MSISLPALMWAADITGFTETEIISALTSELEDEIMWGYKRWEEQQRNNRKSILPALCWAAEKTGFTAREILSELSPELEDEITWSYDRWVKQRRLSDENRNST